MGDGDIKHTKAFSRKSQGIAILLVGSVSTGA